MAEPLLSVVVPCMGRLHQLKLTAPTLLAQPEIEYILVDYSCPDRCGAFARRYWPRAKVVEVPGEKYFNLSRARNVGIRAATCSSLAVLDADNVVAPDFAREVLRLLGEDERLMLREVDSGLLICRRVAVDRVGPYQEMFEGWGGEDDDMFNRLLLAGVRQVRLPSGLVGVLQHSHAERTRFYREKDYNRSSQRSLTLVPFRIGSELRRPWPESLILGVNGANFGDIWKSVQYACWLERVQKVRVQLYAQWHAWHWPDLYSETPLFNRCALAREILATLDTACQPEIVEEAPLEEIIPLGDPGIWHFPYVPTRTTWRGWPHGLHRRIVYQLDGQWQGHLKSPPHEDIPRLLHVAPGFEMVPLGKHLSVQECIEAAAQSDLFIGIDSGMSQLCYSVGVPVFLIGYAMDAHALFNFHGNQHSLWCMDTDDCLLRVRTFLAGAVGNS